MSPLFTQLLVLAVILVNGWTDAPNAIAAVVHTKALNFRKAILLASICNFLGTVVMCLLYPTVAQTVYGLARFSGQPAQALAALQAAFLAIVLWATLAWRFGIPTSESHALLAGVTGACVALHGSFRGIDPTAWGKVLLGLLLSTLLGALAGYRAATGLRSLPLSPGLIRTGQLAGAAVTAFFHGAQDGQKFIALLLLCRALARGETVEQFSISLPLAVLCALVMALGTALGGRRIIDAMGQELAQLSPKEGLAADLGSGICLLTASLLGLPVSTTHTKLSALWGAGRIRNGAASSSYVKETIFTWITTFPGCFLLAWLFTKLMMP